MVKSYLTMCMNYQICPKMDGQTLVNLQIFSNNFNGGSSGIIRLQLRE